MQCNNAILHQLAVLAFVFAPVYFLHETLVLQTFQAAADAANFSLVTKATIHVVGGEGVGQTVIPQPCLLLMAHI